MLRILFVRDVEVDVSDLVEKLRSSGFEVTVTDTPEREADADLVLVYTAPEKVPGWASLDIGAPSCTSWTLMRTSS